MYYLCKFSDTWSILDASDLSSQPLEKNDIECLKKILPKLLGGSTKILVALQIVNIQPNKLVNLLEPIKKETPKQATGATKTPLADK